METESRTEVEVLECEVRIDAEPETVFPYFTDPGRMTRWMGTRAELDPKPGGAYRIDVMGEHVARGEYVEIDPPRRVVMTWGWDSEGAVIRPGASTVEINLVPDGGATVVRLRHHDLPSDESRAQHRTGWEHYLERLATAATGGDPGPDRGPGAGGDAR